MSLEANEQQYISSLYKAFRCFLWQTLHWKVVCCTASYMCRNLI